MSKAVNMGASAVPVIPVSEPWLGGNEERYVLDCLRSGWISSNGVYVTRFEKAFAEFLGVPHAIAVANGTSALHLSLLALGIGPGDEVIVPSLTFVASVNAIRYTGAEPVFVDCETDTWNIDANLIEAAITKRTKAILAVHLYGHPCDMKALLGIAKARHLHLVEDCAEAFGSRYQEKQVGGLGVMGTFSFFGNKTITTGEGGMVVTRDEALAKVVRQTKGQGVSPTREYFFERLGYNYRMTNIEAAIGLAQLERAPELIERKRRNAALYHERLSQIQGLSLPVEREYALNTYWMYSIIVEDSFAVSRDELRKHLKANGVETRPFFHPCHLLPMYQRKQKLAVTESLGARGINLPSATTLTAKQIDHIAKLIRECAG